MKNRLAWWFFIVLSVPLILPKKVGGMLLLFWRSYNHRASFAVLTNVHQEKLDGYKRKKHSILLCFLVAGPRIELGTS